MLVTVMVLTNHRYSSRKEIVFTNHSKASCTSLLLVSAGIYLNIGVYSSLIFPYYIIHKLISDTRHGG